MTAAEGPDGTAGSPPSQASADDPQALVEEINRTREELGNTVEALAAKVDVKARAQERATEFSGQLKGRLNEVKQELSGRVGQVTNGLSGKAAQTRQTVADRGKTVLGAGQPAARQLTGRAAQAGTAAWQSAPEPVQRGAQRAARTMNQYRMPAAAAAGAAGVVLLVAWLAMRWSRR